MLQASGLIPARFLTLTAHLVLTITVLLDREENVMACLPLDHTQTEFDRRDTELAAGLGVTVGLTAIEMVSTMLFYSISLPFDRLNVKGFVPKTMNS